MAETKNEPALGLGERLRSARKARALTLEQAAFTLRLEAATLRALEDEQYAALGAAVFVRGHLKAYARLLGLSEEVVMAAYRAADPNADVPPKVTRELEKPLTTTPGPLAIAAAVGFALLAIVLLYALGLGNRTPRGGDATSGVAPAGIPVPLVESAPVQVEIPLPIPGPDPAPEAATDAAPDANPPAQQPSAAPPPPATPGSFE